MNKRYSTSPLYTFKKILSTKTLTISQQELLLATGIAMVHYDILKIKKLDKPLRISSSKDIIITSSNAIDSFTEMAIDEPKLYVVGEKTAQSLLEKGFQVEIVATSSQDLAEKIIKHHSDKSFLYLCGKQRRDELPQALSSTQIDFTEVKVYEAIEVKKSFDCIFDAVMFYSPRGVHAFAKANPQNIQLAVCIGETTAAAARMYTENVKVARKTTVENTIVTAVKVLLDD